MKRLVTICFVAAALLTSCAGPQRSVVTVYTALEEDQLPVYLASFKAAHPEIEVRLVRNSTGVITARLLAEKSRPQADLVWGTAATSLMLLKQQGMLQPYAPEGIARVKTRFRDADSIPSWVGIDVFMTAFAVNTVECGEGKVPVPHSFADLLDTVYTGKITMPDPASSGTGFFTVTGILQLFGEERGWEYLDQLHRRIACYTHSGSKPAKLVGTGEYLVGITFDYRSVMQSRKGEPVATVFPREGSGWDMEANALIRKPNVNPAAKVFLDWAISDAALREVAKNFPIVTVDLGTPIPPEFPTDPLAQLIENDLAWSAANRDRILAEWTRRYDGKSEPK